MDEWIKEIEPTMLDLIEKHTALNLKYETQKHQDFRQTLSKLNRRDLVIIKTIVDIGLSGRGVIHDYGSDDPKTFEIEIKETAEILLERFSGFLSYNDHELLVEKLSQEAEFSYGLMAGLDLLKELENREDRIPKIPENWTTAPNLDEDEAGKIVTLIQTGIQENRPIYFWVASEAVEKIEELRANFIDWIQNAEGIYPYRQYVKQLNEGEVLYEGYIYRYSCYEFVDWMNSYVYQKAVAKKTCKPDDFIDPIIIEF